MIYKNQGLTAQALTTAHALGDMLRSQPSNATTRSIIERFSELGLSKYNRRKLIKAFLLGAEGHPIDISAFLPQVEKPRQKAANVSQKVPSTQQTVTSASPALRTVLKLAEELGRASFDKNPSKVPSLDFALSMISKRQKLTKGFRKKHRAALYAAFTKCRNQTHGAEQSKSLTSRHAISGWGRGVLEIGGLRSNVPGPGQVKTFSLANRLKAVDTKNVTASNAQLDCVKCQELPPNVLCGLCVERKYGAQAAGRGRKRPTPRSIKRNSQGVRSRTQLQCQNRHTWISNVDYSSDSSLATPRCPSCRQYFTSQRRVLVTLRETTKCDGRCWGAEHFRCVCSCGGVNHGRNSVGR
jgi:hypothetical protein